MAAEAKQRYKLYGGAMGGGKSRWLCEEIVRQMCIFPGNRGLLLRATLADFKLSTYLTLIEVLKPFIESGVVNENKQDRYFDFHLPGGTSRLYYGGLDVTEKEKEKYFSTEYGCIGIDEAREATEDHFKKLGTRLRHKLPNGKMPEYYILLASNPSQNWLKTRFILSPDPEKYLFVPALPRENKYNPPDYEDQIKDLFHGDANFIKAYLEGSWDSVASIDDLILMEDLHKCFDIKISAAYDRRLTSIDFARMGDDTTAIYNIENGNIISQESSGKKTSDETIGRIMYNREKNKSRMIAMGFNGMDTVVYDWLNQINGEISEPVSLLGVDFSKEASDPSRFYNLRAEVYWYVREQIKNRAVSIPRDDVELQGQLCAIKYKFKGGPKGTRILIEDKEVIKKQIGKSPDKADAWVIGILALQWCPFDKDKPTWKERYKEEVPAGSAMSA